VGLEIDPNIYANSCNYINSMSTTIALWRTENFVTKEQQLTSNEF
jgi:hypothetical protein